MKITQKPSPNFTPGRTARIDRIVMHWIVGNLASADATFANPKSQVSAHYGIEGRSVHQYVKESDTAWHAMEANSRSIGIEHSAAPNRPAAPSTLETSAQLIAQIAKRYNLPLNRTTVIKHSEVVPTQCPRTIPIDSIIKRANELLKGEEMLRNRNHLVYLFRQFVNRGPTAAEERDYLSKTYDYAMNKLVPARLNVAKLVIDNKNLKEQNSAHINRIKELEAQLAVQSDDTKNLNAFGEALRWLISRLGIK